MPCRLTRRLDGKIAISTTCPYHDDTHPSFWALFEPDGDNNSLRLLTYKCFACSDRLRDIPRNDIIRYLQDCLEQHGYTISQGQRSYHDKSLSSQDSQQEPLMDVDNAEAYLMDICKTRHIDIDIARRYGLKVVRHRERLALYCPIRCMESGDVISYQLRYCDNEEPRFYNQPQQPAALSLIQTGTPHDPIVITEGILKGLVLASHYSACTIVAGCGTNNVMTGVMQAIPTLQRWGSTIILALDYDKPGIEAAKQLRSKLREAGLHAYTLDYARMQQLTKQQFHSGLGKGKTGIDDYICILKQMDVALTRETIFPIERRLNVSRASAILEQVPKWLIPNWIPCGAITIIEGDPGVGKSMLSLAIGIAVTTGGTIYVEDAIMPVNVTGPVLLLAYEDAPGIIAARLRHINQTDKQLDNFFIIDETISLPEDAPDLIAIVNETQARLVIIDPITAYLGRGLSYNSDQDVRKALNSLTPLLKQGVSVCCIRHLKKAATSEQTNLPSLYRGIGSIGFVGLARSVITIERQPDGSSKAVLIKSNYASTGAAFTYVAKTLAVRLT